MRREITLVGPEILWLAKILHRLSPEAYGYGFIECLTEGAWSVACWLIEEEQGTAVQVVETVDGKRRQIFVPSLKVGDRWEGVALVLEGYARMGELRKGTTSFEWPVNFMRVNENPN